MFSLPHSSGIYAIRCLVSGRVYIGSSQDICKRFQAHRTLLRSGKHHCIGLQRAWNKHGELSFVVDVLEITDKGVLLEREQVWFDTIGIRGGKHTYNASYVAGAPMKGRQHSDATRKVFSDSRQGEKNPNYRGGGDLKVCAGCGIEFRTYYKKHKYCSHECYAKAPKSAETMQKYKDTSKGRKRTPEAIEKGRQKLLGWFIVTDPNGVVYQVHGLAQFCREHGLDQGTMSRVSLGRSKAHKGWLCKKIDAS